MTWNRSVSEDPFGTILEDDGSSKTVLQWLGNTIPDIEPEMTVLFPGHGNLRMNKTKVLSPKDFLGYDRIGYARISYSRISYSRISYSRISYSKIG